MSALPPIELAAAIRETHNRAGPAAAVVVDRVVGGLLPAERGREFANLVRAAAALAPPCPNRRALAQTLRAKLLAFSRSPRSVYIDGGTMDGLLETAWLVYQAVPTLKTIERALAFRVGT